VSIQEVGPAPTHGSEPASERFYEIAGRRLSIEAEAGSAGDLAESYVRGFHLLPCPRPDADRLDLRIQIVAERPPLPTGLRQFEIPEGVCHADQRRHYLDVGGSRVVVEERAARRVRVWFGEAARVPGSFALITTMAYAMPAALRRGGLYDLHATGMVEPESGHGFLFPGSSGSGKTSLAVRLGAAGWQYMSDDLMLLCGERPDVEMWPLRRHFQADAVSLANCPLPRLEEALGIVIATDPDKRRLRPTILFPGRFVASATPRVICFPVITGEMESRVEALGQAEAMMRLVRMCPWSSYDLAAARDHLRLLGRLVRQCKLFTLRAGRDIFDSPERAGRLLASLA
jgi:hypothetical protein